mmetsp:Transcript_112788/g.364120  ORF Transcript_112788/g.364120 Transcript_112788/m.364120 type:complete len:435 (-) Transcript_112788:88-1392(-)
MCFGREGLLRQRDVAEDGVLLRVLADAPDWPAVRSVELGQPVGEAVLGAVDVRRGAEDLVADGVDVLLRGLQERDVVLVLAVSLQDVMNLLGKLVLADLHVPEPANRERRFLVETDLLDVVLALQVGECHVRELLHRLVIGIRDRDVLGRALRLHLGRQNVQVTDAQGLEDRALKAVRKHACVRVRDDAGALVLELPEELGGPDLRADGPGRLAQEHQGLELRGHVGQGPVHGGPGVVVAALLHGPLRLVLVRLEHVARVEVAGAVLDVNLRVVREGVGVLATEKSFSRHGVDKLLVARPDIEGELVPAGASAIEEQHELIAAAGQHLEGVVRDVVGDAARAAAREDHEGRASRHPGDGALLRLVVLAVADGPDAESAGPAEHLEAWGLLLQATPQVEPMPLMARLRSPAGGRPRRERNGPAVQRCEAQRGEGP